MRCSLKTVCLLIVVLLIFVLVSCGLKEPVISLSPSPSPVPTSVDLRPAPAPLPTGTPDAALQARLDGLTYKYHIADIRMAPLFENSDAASPVICVVQGGDLFYIDRAVITTADMNRKVSNDRVLIKLESGRYGYFKMKYLFLSGLDVAPPSPVPFQLGSVLPYIDRSLKSFQVYDAVNEDGKAALLFTVGKDELFRYQKIDAFKGWYWIENSAGQIGYAKNDTMEVYFREGGLP